MTTDGLALAGSRRRWLLSGHDAIRWTAIFVFVALGIGLRSPWPADEPRFALAAMDMVLNHHWLLPHRGGEIYADKPPVFMWLEALFFLLTGNMRIAFLMPSLIASMATLWMVYDLGRRIFSREQAWFGVLVLLATVQFTAQAKSGQIDATVCAFTTLGIYGLMRHFCLGPDYRWYAIAWLAMGTGIITKGVGFLPVFLLPGILVAHWLTARQLRLRSPDWRTVAAPFLILLPALLWLLPLMYAAYAGGRADVATYLDEILFRQTVTRYAEGLGHFRPPWYYLTAVIPGLWMPVSVMLFWLVPDWSRQLRQFNRAHWALLSFVLLSFLFFSLSPGKRGVYMLPLLPPLAILAGGSMPALTNRRALIRVLRAIVLVLGVLLLLAAAAIEFDLGKLGEQLEQADMDRLPTLLLLATIGVAWLVAAILLRKGGAFTLAIAGTWLLLCTWGYVLLDPVRSAGELMAEVSTHLGPHDELAIIDFREQQLLQADRSVVHWGYHDDVQAQVDDAARWLMAGDSRHLLVAESAAMPCFGNDVGTWLGHRHRRDWRLVTAADIPTGTACAQPSSQVTRYESPFVGYPHGPR